MSDYTYDDSFYGLLTVFALLFESKVNPASIENENSHADLFRIPEFIDTDERRAEHLLAKIKTELPKSTLRYFTFAFFSESPRREIVLYHYLKLAFAHSDVNARRDNPWVAKTLSLAHKVGKEVHRYKGFVRFSRLPDDLYYAVIKPDYNILPLLAPHFVKRLSDQNWIIHDLKRGQGVFYDQRECRIGTIAKTDKIPVTQTEQFYRRLWKQYFDTIGISERSNPRLQQQFIPLRYRKHLVEMAETVPPNP